MCLTSRWSRRRCEAVKLAVHPDPGFRRLTSIDVSSKSSSKKKSSKKSSSKKRPSAKKRPSSKKRPSKKRPTSKKSSSKKRPSSKKMPEKVLNPKTNRMVMVGKKVHQQLCKEGALLPKDMYTCV